MARRSKPPHPYEVQRRLIGWITHLGYTPKQVKKLNRALPDNEFPILLLDAYECIGQLEGENSTLGMKLTMKEKDLE